MAKKFDIKNVSMVFFPFVPAHIEYFKDGRPFMSTIQMMICQQKIRQLELKIISQMIWKSS